MATGLLFPEERLPNRSENNSEVDEEGYWAELKSNFGPSAWQLVKDLAQPFIHPIETFNGLKALVGEDPSARQAVGQYMMERYGGLDNVAESFKTDPVGVASDILGLASGGAFLAGKTAIGGSRVARVGQIANMLDPANVPLNVAGATARGVTTQIPLIPAMVGLQTGVGTDTALRAIETGLEGGQRSERFRTGRRGLSNVQDLVDELRKSIKQVGSNRRQKYRQQRGNLSNVLVKVKPIRDRIAQLKSERIGTAGFADASDPVLARLEKIEDMLDARVKGKAHRVLDMDTFSKNVDALASEITDPAGAVTASIVSEIKDAIGVTDPKYLEMMKDYNDMKALERELRVAFNAKPGDTTTVQQVLKKMMQATRQNVNTDMGGIGTLLDTHAPGVLDELSGRAMNPSTPVGMQRIVASAGGYGGIGGGAFTANPWGVLAGATALSGSSPRLMGTLLHEGARYGPQVAGGATDFSRIFRGTGVGPSISRPTEVQVPLAPPEEPPVMPGGLTADDDEELLRLLEQIPGSG